MNPHVQTSYWRWWGGERYRVAQYYDGYLFALHVLDVFLHVQCLLDLTKAGCFGDKAACIQASKGSLTS